MELRPGFKATEVGVIPEEWDVATFDQVFKRQNAKAYQIQTSSYQRNGALPVVDQGQKAVVGYSDRADRRFACPDDGVIVFGDHTCIVKFVDFDFVVGADGTQLLTAKTGHSTRFHAYALEHRGIASTGYNRHFKFLKERRYVSPHLPEQRAIAAALSDVAALLAKLDQLIAKKRDLKQAAMQQLLTGQTRLPGFAGEWQTKAIKDIVLTPVTDGPHLTPRFLDDGIPFLSVNNLVDNKIDLADLRFISRADHEEFSRKCKPRKGDVLLGKAASVGKVAIVDLDIEFNIWSPIALIRVGGSADARFVYYQLQSKDVVRQITLLTNSSSQGNIGMGDIEKLTLALPQLDEQTAIVTVLSDMDAEITALEARRDKTRALKQGMMQELLTGRIRLV
jgi:type I restriction enzyme S subunit